jgi:DNA-binding NtrC family response regulator
MNGGDVYDAVKAIDPGVTALLSSGYSRDGRADNILGAGCNGFIQKPFSMAKLSEKVGEILGRRQSL